MYPTSEHPSVHFLFLPPGMSFSVCVHCIIGNKLQTFILGIQHFSWFHFKSVHFFPILYAVGTGLIVRRRLFVLLRKTDSVAGHHESIHWKLCSSVLKRRGDRNGGQQLPLSSIIVCNCSQGVLLSSIGRSKLIFSIYNWNILVGNSIKFATLRLIKMGGVALQLKKGKRK